MRRLRPFGPAARIAASVAMLAVLLSRLHLSGLLPANHHSAVAFAYQLAVALAAYLAAGALDLDVGWTAILAFMPAVAIVQVLPLTVGGLGRGFPGRAPVRVSPDRARHPIPGDSAGSSGEERHRQNRAHGGDRGNPLPLPGGYPRLGSGSS